MEPLPEGLLYRPEFLTLGEERRLLDDISRVYFQPVRMHGVVARRRVVHYGLIYGYDSWRLAPGPPIPEFLETLQDRCAEWMGLTPEALQEVLLTEYTPGASIGWHRDAPMFGAIIGVSLGAPCRMRFRSGEGTDKRGTQLVLEPRSVYALTGAVREGWQHHIPPTKDLRYSVTFRTIREGRSPRSTIAESSQPPALLST
jgi:alkylated DNA repair dioxygenase AlkB